MHCTSTPSAVTRRSPATNHAPCHRLESEESVGSLVARPRTRVNSTPLSIGSVSSSTKVSSKRGGARLCAVCELSPFRRSAAVRCRGDSSRPMDCSIVLVIGLLRSSVSSASRSSRVSPCSSEPSCVASRPRTARTSSSGSTRIARLRCARVISKAATAPSAGSKQSAISSAYKLSAAAETKVRRDEKSSFCRSNGWAKASITRVSSTTTKKGSRLMCATLDSSRRVRYVRKKSDTP
eukprot:5468575-Pleurochrysis_carterae.AAC.4